MYDSIREFLLFLPVSLLLAACSQDEIPGGDILPEGKYPLEIASVTMSAEVSSQPWTRVAESEDGNSSEWKGYETIIAQIGNDNTNRGTYRVIAEEGNIFLHPIERIYWKSTTPQIVKGWYPSVGETIDLSQQDADYGLAYALYAETKTVNYQTPDITLPFEHKLAKVRVVLEGSDKDKVDDVMIKAYTSCTIDADGVVKVGDTENFIPMVKTTYNNGETCWEANVVPGEAIMEFQVNGKDGQLDGNGITPLAAKVNTITLTVGKTATEIKDGETITGPGDYLMKGEYSQTITIENGDGVTLTLDGATSTAATALEVVSGHPTIIVKGENTFDQPAETGPSTIALDGADAHITLDGQGSGKLTIKQSSQQVGTAVVIGGAMNSAAGNILIQDLTPYRLK